MADSQHQRLWWWRAYVKTKAHIARTFPLVGASGVMNNMGVTRKFAEYTYRKSIDPNFHPDTQGGARNTLLDDDEEEVAEYLLWIEVQTNPARCAAVLCGVIVVFVCQEAQGFRIGTATSGRTCKRGLGA